MTTPATCQALDPRCVSCGHDKSAHHPPISAGDYFCHDCGHPDGFHPFSGLCECGEPDVYTDHEGKYGHPFRVARCGMEVEQTGIPQDAEPYFKWAWRHAGDPRWPHEAEGVAT